MKFWVVNVIDNRISLNELDCVGCTGCMNICPKVAISMQYNQNGFKYPVIDEDKCVKCGICVKHCQMYNPYNITKENPQAYIAITKNHEIYKNSASGGVFGTLAKSFFERYPNSVVVGAAFENGMVSHIIIDSPSDIIKLQNSKYVQSELNFTFSAILEHLKNGKYVFFSGTPCQVYALKLFLKEEYDKLITVDLICHGVPSPQYLNRDLKAYGTKIDKLKFRYKTKKARSGFILSMVCDGKKVFSLSNRDPYYAMFMNNLSFRDACYRCKFANLNRVGDITIGDCDSHCDYPNFHPRESTSTVIINNKKGYEIWKLFKNDFDYQNLDIIKESNVNTQLKKSSKLPQNRDEILADINNYSVNELQMKYAKPNDIKGKILLFINRFF